MSWSRCSKLGLALLVLLAAVAVPAVATDVEPSPAVDEAEVGSNVDVRYTLTDVFNDTNTDWTLEASTNLTQPTWTVTRYDPQGNVVGQTQQTTTATTSTEVTSEVARIEVRVQGTVPTVANYTYEPAQNTTLASFTRVQGNARTPVFEDLARPYTADSLAAREAIDNASVAIETARNAGAGVSAAEETFGSAVAAYDGENFDNAVTLAERAQREAEAASASSQQRNTLLMVGAGVVVLLLLAALVYWYRQQQDTYDELG